MTSYLEAAAAAGANAWWRYVLSIGLALGLAIALTVAIIIPLQLSHLWPRDFARLLQDSSRPVSFFLFNGMAFVVVLAGFVAAIGWVHHKRFGDIIGAWTGRAFGAGVGVWLAALTATTIIDFAIAPTGFQVTANGQTPWLAVAALGALGVQTFTEEFVFRGYLTQGLLLATQRPLAASVISGLLFGAIHIPNGAPQAVNATFFGVLLSMIAIRTGGIAFTYGLHLANNLFSAVVVVSSNDAFRGSPALITQNTPHLMWWDTAVGVLALIGVTVMIDRIPWRARPTRIEPDIKLL